MFSRRVIFIIVAISSAVSMMFVVLMQSPWVQAYAYPQTLTGIGWIVDPLATVYATPVGTVEEAACFVGTWEFFAFIALEVYLFPRVVKRRQSH